MADGADPAVCQELGRCVGWAWCEDCGSCYCCCECDAGLYDWRDDWGWRVDWLRGVEVVRVRGEFL